MLLLRNNQQFNAIVTYDADNGRWHGIDSERSKRIDPRSVSGFFSILSSKFCALYRSEQEIIICVGDVRIQLSPQVKIHLAGNPERRRLTISRDEIVIVDHEYSVDTSNQFENDPTPFIEDEDFDFGLFMANIAESQERQEILKGNA